MRALVDTNVVLDSLLSRAPWHIDADAIMRRAHPGVLELAISALTVANLFYVGRRLVGAARARQDVRTCLRAFEILAIDARALHDADALPGNDFEDNLQMAIAVCRGREESGTSEMRPRRRAFFGFSKPRSATNPKSRQRGSRISRSFRGRANAASNGFLLRIPRNSTFLMRSDGL
jgi:predicted nucleic acid-binding protein